MKFKLVALILLLSFSTTDLAAQYIPFVEEGKFWFYMRHDNLDYPSAYSGYAISLLGDTIINNLNYKKVLQLELTGYGYYPYQDWEFDIPYQTSSINTISHIREDIAEKKVYVLPIDSTEEYLLLDFSLELGDTLNDYVYESIQADAWETDDTLGIVEDISLMDSYGIARNTFLTTGVPHTGGLLSEIEIRIIEGIGTSIYGIFSSPYQPITFESFCEGGINACNILLSVRTYFINSGIDIYPNPSTGKVNVSPGSELIRSIKLFTVHGQFISELEYSHVIELDFLENGMYLLELKTESEKTFIQKMILE